MKKFGSIAFALVLFLLPLVAQEKPKDSPSMEELMAAYMKYSAPGEHHKKLNALKGDFTVKAKFRASPEQPWNESTSDVTGEWVLGNRFLMQKVVSSPDAMMPQGFEGLGLFGYDNYQDHYVMAWMDTMSTMQVTAKGSLEDDKIAFKGNYVDPLSGKERVFKWVYEVGSDGTVSQQMYEQGPDGELFVNAKMSYEKR